jgi:predicted ATP-grasp superfamily ATP-dependent carboligase
VLITNAEERSMLAVARTLHAGGYEVIAASSNRWAVARWSRASSHAVHIVDARDDAERFIAGLASELERGGLATVIPGTDSALLAISQARSRLQELTRLGLPRAEVIEKALSREQLSIAASAAGFTIPETIRCENHEQVWAVAAELGFPLIVKSINSAAGMNSAVRGAPKGHPVWSEQALPQALAEFSHGLLVQRYLHGDVISVGGAIGDSRLLGAVVARYRRMWPAEGGSTTFAETIESPPRLEQMVTRLLAEIGWEGIFELEFIRSATERLVPIDFNPRPYGSMALAAAAGVPLAAIWCDWLLGDSPGDPRDVIRARPGVRYRWEDGDLRHLSWQLRRGHSRAAGAVLRPHRRVAHAHFQLGDPLPLLARGLDLGTRMLELRERTRSQAPQSR